MRKSKKVALGIGIGITMFILIIILNLHQKEPCKKVKIEKIKKQDIVSVVRIDGEIKAEKQVNIGTEVMGKIQKIMVKEGDKVKKGTPLFRIDPTSYIIKVKELRAKLTGDLAKYENIKKELERAKTLFKDSLISKAEYENILSQYKTMIAVLSADSASLEDAEIQLSKTIVKSPIDGEVIAVYKEEGENVIVGRINIEGSVVMVVADMSKMVVSCYADEAEIPKIKPGQPAKIKVDAYPDIVFKGKVKKIVAMPASSSIQTQTSSYPVEVEIEKNKKGIKLLPGMSATCEIITGRKKNVITVPLTAVGKKEKQGKKSQDFVFVYKNGKAEMRTVKLGIKGEHRVEVVKGLKEGEEIITGPYTILKTLKHGERVCP